ncbi:MAG: LPS export ABC transporter ATP-binding protein [Ignavibacteriales bacterium CG07_land_8_20_14_0_80_59_12]|nr:MAG: LPS export ABC transporter ATP-binding protein [Ignavibacteriales bacterium CG07_land_8_20_14_0_80_59_12]
MRTPQDLSVQPVAASDKAGPKPGLVLRAEHLSKRYRQRTVVNDVSLDVRQGEVVGLLGPNGAGKTTTFYMIVGLIRPLAGNVFLEGADVTRFPMYRRARLGIGYLPQEASIFRKLSVRDNILAVLEQLPLKPEERARRCDGLLSEFGIDAIAGSKGYMLSGGERRRTEIARAIATNPKFILLDEPFAGIDPIAVEDLMKLVHTLKDRGIGVLITDHNVHETLSITDRAYLLYDGHILRSGTSESLASDEKVRKLYLGEKFRLDRYE